MNLRDQISASSLERKLLAGGVLFVIVIALLFAIYSIFFRVQYDVLFSDLRPADAAAIVAELDQQGMPYRLANSETSILVPVDKMGETRIAIAGSELPIKGAVGFELFNESDMGLTEFAQKINYQRALQGELARTIMMMDEVESARVHLTIPERAIFRGEKSVPKAAVTIHTRLGRILTAESVDGIQKLIASAVNDLQLADVSILDKDGRIISQSGDSEDFSGPEIAEKEAVEQYYRARIASAIDGVAPVPNIRVVVTATSIAIGSGGQDEAQELTPSREAERNFRLFVRLVTPVNLNEEDSARIRQAAADAVAFDEQIGDRIIFSKVAGTTPVASDPARPQSGWNNPVPDKNAASVPGPDPKEYQSLSSWLAGLAAIVILLFGTLLWTIRRRGSLSREERTSFASQLNAELLAEKSS